MSNPRKRKATKAKADLSDLANLDLDPDAWPKFEALVKSAAKMGHKPHIVPTKKVAKKKTGNRASGPRPS